MFRSSTVFLSTPNQSINQSIKTFQTCSLIKYHVGTHGKEWMKLRRLPCTHAVEGATIKKNFFLKSVISCTGCRSTGVSSPRSHSLSSTASSGWQSSSWWSCAVRWALLLVNGPFCWWPHCSEVLVLAVQPFSKKVCLVTRMFWG